ncbi:MAG TPA: YaaC family protein [Chondromyces sp.]|nr:YaaC family protein [Chondromyces sp.]
MAFHFNDSSPQLIYFQSQNTSQTYLENCYGKIKDINTKEAAFNNCYRFMYFLEYGQLYLQQASLSPLAIKPSLAFYGLTHLLKACLLTVDPAYPSTTNVLAHGLSARKKKKQNYHFLEDEVKIQRNGLFPYAIDKMFHMKHFEGEKLIMKDLLLQIPELADAFNFHYQANPFVELKADQHEWLLSKKAAIEYQLSDQRFIELITYRGKKGLKLEEKDDKFFKVMIPPGRVELPPFRKHIYKKTLFFSKNKVEEAYFPELLIHYGLLYNLSMIARYETEWWAELLKTAPTEDYPFIEQFLSISIMKIPLLIIDFLTP